MQRTRTLALPLKFTNVQCFCPLLFSWINFYYEDISITVSGTDFILGRWIAGAHEKCKIQIYISRKFFPYMMFFCNSNSCNSNSLVYCIYFGWWVAGAHQQFYSLGTITIRLVLTELWPFVFFLLKFFSRGDMHNSLNSRLRFWVIDNWRPFAEHKKP